MKKRSVMGLLLVVALSCEGSGCGKSKQQLAEERIAAQKEIIEHRWEVRKQERADALAKVQSDLAATVKEQERQDALDNALHEQIMQEK